MVCEVYYPRCCDHPMGLIGDVHERNGRLAVWRCNRCDRVVQVEEAGEVGYSNSHQLPEFVRQPVPLRRIA